MDNRPLDIDKLKEKINRSKVFYVSTDSSLFQIELYELISDIYQYLNIIGKKYQDCGLEIVETVHECLRSYNMEKGLFLPYFLVALKHKIGSKVSDSMFFADSLTGRESGDDYNLIDHIPDVNFVEDEFLRAEAGKKILEALDVEYVKCNESQQRILSLLLTSKILKTDHPSIIDNDLDKQSFCNQDVLLIYHGTGKIMTFREIASIVGRSETSVNRTYHHFIERVKRRYYGY